MTHFCADFQQCNVNLTEIFSHLPSFYCFAYRDSIHWRRGRSLTKQTEVLLRNGDWWSSEEALEFVIRIQRLVGENANLEGDESNVSIFWLLPHIIDFWALSQRFLTCLMSHSDHSWKKSFPENSLIPSQAIHPDQLPAANFPQF